MSNPEDYAVGWICAISTEHVATQSFLDEKHGAPSSVAKHDNNDYTLGRIGEHNVVIAVLPDGEYGIASAASVARDMLHSFPNVRIGLMVGIGGGAPSPSHDIRLGDVVVSAPRGGIGGVFQYDFGKKIQNQSFQTTGFLNQPPTVLRTAMAGLKSEYESEGHQFEATIRSILDKKPRLRKKYSRPDQTSDRLYQSNIVHPVDSAESCKIVCGGDQSTLVPRRDREDDQDNPAVHHGLIASANQLMKDASMRDALAAEMDVLCFEMEAAGLMNQFPCLVIRGICDYADSHKNKEWQGYAAMTAAAYAKDLLYRIPPNKVEAEQKIKDALSQVLNNIDYIRREWERKEDLEILDWITPLNYGPQHSDFIRRRQPGTGQWLLESAEYKTWLADTNQTLFCTGIPGSGKTILTAIVVEDLITRTPDKADIGLAYIYCNFKRQHEQNIEDLIGSLLKQLTRKRPCLPDIVRRLHQKHSRDKTRPSLDGLVEALRLVITMYSKVFVVIDALDECVAFNRTRAMLLSYISSLRTDTAVSLFATSRHIPAIEKEFEGSLRKQVLASEEDLLQYIEAHMKDLPDFLSDMDLLKREIESKILQAAQGMFLLVHLSLDLFRGKTSLAEVKSALKRLKSPKHEEAGHPELQTVLEQAYDEAMDRIDHQSPDQQRLGRNALEWITCAKRPLTQLELQYALAVKPGDSTVFDPDNIREVDSIISVCAGLVTIDEDSNVVRLVHYTTQEYFDQRQTQLFPDADRKIAVLCCNYLTNVARGVHRDSDEGDKNELRSASLYDYAGQNWWRHARLLPGIPRCVRDFMTCRTTVEAAAQALHYGGMGWNGLHLAAFLGIYQAVDFLPNNSEALNSPDVFGRTPLTYAVENRHQDIVRLLIEKGAAIDTEDWYHRTPLFCAIESHDESMVCLLYEMGADFKTWHPSRSERLSHSVLHSTEGTMRLFLENCSTGDPDGVWARTLRDAIIGGHVGYVKLLLEKVHNSATDFLVTLGDVDEEFVHGQLSERSAEAQRNHALVVNMVLEKERWTELEERDRESLLFLAARHDRMDAVRLLLQLGVSIQARDWRSRTALSYAACGGCAAIVKLLLEQGLEIDGRDQHGRTPLSLAADSNEDCTAAIQLLLDSGAEVDARDDCGNTPLMQACAVDKIDHRYKTIKTIQLLLDREAAIEARDNDGKTALMKAADRSYVWLLLERGAMVEATDNSGMTALMHAVSKGREEIVKELLSAGANANARDIEGDTALLHAWELGDVLDHMIQIFVDCGASVNAKNSCGRTILMGVAERGLISSINLLLDNGAAIEETNENGQTALLHALYEDEYDAVVALLDGGADIEAKDNWGNTALHHAATTGRHRGVEVLLDEGADIKAKDDLGQTALIHAVHAQSTQCITVLLGRGAEMEERDGLGQTALVHAAQDGDLLCMEMLITEGADYEALDSEGKTALFHAVNATENALGAVEILLDSGAAPDARDFQGRTALSHAVKHGNKSEVVQLLRRRQKMASDGCIIC